MDKVKLAATGERFVPQLDGVIRLEHVHRYLLACSIAKGKDVLDIACGEGYGSDLLAEAARSVTGVDISQEAVAHAKINYSRNGLTFQTGSATDVPLANSTVDLVVSFETIEHLQDHDKMMSELRRVLRKRGVLLISSPNKQVYSDRDGYKNPFHERELYTKDFIELVKSHFKNVAHYGQKTTGSSVIAAADGSAPMVTYSDTGIQSGIVDQRYDLIVAGDGPLPLLPNSLYEIPGGPLQPENAEVRLSHLGNEIQKTMGEVHRLADENFSLRTDQDSLRAAHTALVALNSQTQEENSVLRQTNAATRSGLNRLAADANKILKDKWWRRTRPLRKLSNSLRKLQGKPKKRWPKAFVANDYLTAANAVAKPAKVEKPKTPAFVPSFFERVAPRLTVVAMARNEAQRVHDSMRHFCALFDRVVLVDHLSDDGTAEIARGYNGVANTEVTVLRGEDAGYYQSEYMSAVANALLSEGESDWIFFMDFDEFLPFADAKEFRQALVDVAECDVIHGHWYNLALTKFDSGTLQDADAHIGPVVSSFVKIAINSRRIQPGQVTICQGNHAVVLPGETTPYIGDRAFGLFHVPFVNIDALRRKVEQGSESLKETVGKTAIEGSHWRDLKTSIGHLAASDDLAREVALNYGHPLNEIMKAVAAGQLTTNARKIRFRFAQSEASTGAISEPGVERFTLDTIVPVLRSQFPNRQSHDSLEPLGTALYSSLGVRSRPRPDLGAGRDRIEYAILAGSANVEVVVQTVWQGHIPFLFSLMETLRPRRYVELGAHAGASFFAACQHMRANGNYGEAVAIDLWTGDHQSGFYKETVFDNFKMLLNRHFPETGKFIRAYFKDAAASFQDKSIDLLHIDGLHTYDAVKEDYETWLPKLAENGVIIFHDTNEFQTDFGVWQLFNEVRSQATASFQFRHTHGLGVMAFGLTQNNPAIELLEHFNTRPEKIESHYSVLGQALFDAARFRLS